MTGRRRLAAVAAVAALALAGCGGGNSQDVSQAAADKLQPQVQRVRDAVHANSEARVSASLNELRRMVEQERAAGRLSDGRAQDILDAADTLQRDFMEKISSPSPSPTPSSESPSPTPTPTTESPSPTPSPTTQSPLPSPTPTATVTVTVGPSVGVGGGTSSGTPTTSTDAGAPPTDSSTPAALPTG